MSTRATAAYRYLSFKGGGTVAKQLMWSQETCGLVGPLPSGVLACVSHFICLLQMYKRDSHVVCQLRKGSVCKYSIYVKVVVYMK